MRKLGDHPLVAHAILKSEEATQVDSVALTTDSQEIAHIGSQYGVDTVIERPASLASDNTPLAPVVEHALDEADGEFDYVLCFQPTVPLVTAESIDSGIEVGLGPDADSVVYVRDATHHYWKKTGNGMEPISRERRNRQQMDPIYEEIGLFLSHRDVVNQGERIGETPQFHVVDHDEGVDIDTYGDWVLAESYLRRQQMIYRVTGSNETGSGHVFRGITIADNLFEHDVLFAVGPDDDLAMEKLEESNYDYRVFDTEDEFLTYVRSSEPSVVVNDILDTSTAYITSLTDINTRVVNFEDLGDGAKHADAVINALYEYSDPPANHYFGFKYFCLRNEFRYARPHKEIKSVDTIMISFGGTDENNLTAKTLEALSLLEDDLHLDIVLGLGYRETETLEAILDSMPSNFDIEVSQDVNSMADHMEQADLLITSNGRTLYEASSLNTPMISIAQNQREQRHPYAHVSQGILFLGQADYVSEGAIRSAVTDYIQDPQYRETMRAALADQDIEGGIERIKSILFNQ